MIIKSVTLLAGLLLLSISSYAANVEFRLSKIHALVNFAETAIGEPHRSLALREFFEASAMNTPEVRAALTHFKNAHRQLGEGFEYLGFPNMRKQGSSGESLLLVQSVFANDIDDLESRTIGIMPLSAHLELVRALRGILPHYEKHIWKPYLTKLEKKKNIFEEIAHQANLDKLFSQASKFYNASWPLDRKFVIALYPIPGANGQSSAQSLESVESVGVMTEEEDDPGRFGIIFHELCHSLYSAQTPAFQSDLNSWFEADRTAYGNLAYSRINEALATALGNGFAFERATGKADAGTWYNDRYIEGFARGIFPMVKNYISNGKSIDSDFVKTAIKIFEEKFPKAPYEFDNLFNRIVLLLDTEKLDRDQIRESMNQNFRISSRSTYSQLDDIDGINEIKKSTDTVVIIASLQNKLRMDALAEAFAATKEHIKAVESFNSPSLYWAELSPGRSMLILLVENTDQAVNFFQAMKKKSKIDPTSPVQDM